VIVWSNRELDAISKRNEMNTSPHLPVSEMAPTPFAAEPAAETQAIIHPPHLCDVPWDIVASRRNSTRNVVPEPLTAGPSGLEHGRRLRWKPLGLKEVGQRSANAVKLRDDGMSRRYSPRLDAALTPFSPFLYLCLLQHGTDSYIMQT
jgi:hypothetical protein